MKRGYVVYYRHDLSVGHKLSMFDSSRYTFPQAFLDMAFDVIIFKYETVNTVSNK